MFGLSACVSDALPREEDDPADGASSDMGPDVRDASASDTARVDAADAAPTQEGSIPEASADVFSDDAMDDPSTDVAVIDAGDDRAVDASGFDASDVAPGADASDARGDAPLLDADDAGTVSDTLTPPNDAVDANVDGSTAIDVSDAPISPNDANDTNDAGIAADAIDARDGASDTALDATTDAKDAADGGVVVFYTENFDTGLGGFSSAVNVCGTASSWSNASGYAHATEPATEGVTRISSPAILVPATATNVTLRMSHKFALEDGWDSAQLLIGVNGGTATLVTTFSSGGYTSGGATNPTTCASPLQSQYPGWSGTQTTEQTSVTNLAGVVGNDTVTITFRILTDQAVGGAGWDINWVTLSATVP